MRSSAAGICGAKTAFATLVFAMIPAGAAIELRARALAFWDVGVRVGMGAGSLMERVMATAGPMSRGFSGGVIGSEALPVASGNSDFGMLVAGISTAPKVTGWGWFFGVRTKGTVGKMGVVCGTVDADASADGLASVGYAAAGSVAEIGGAGRIGSAASIFVATIG
jgi:hypothetical protein